ncbi:O-antigen polymerase [Sporosarcina sp. Marseille-Q4943]|uniref:O-antigen polymerase n=1 Tax=Sporosarcina sp. Marseille-Q4943 TaxID=2942204 RepID=UPI00208DCFF8|nr:O-antigen polymerase [Sporosarcina sp. Marseille-Q4943]
MNSIYFKKGLYYIFLSLMAIYIYLSDNYKIILIAFLVTILYSMICVKFTLHHPFVWFLPFYFMYSCSSAVLTWQDVKPFSDNVVFLLKASWFSMLPLLLIINTKIGEYHALKPNKRNNIYFFFIVWGGALLLNSLSLVSISLSGFTNKREINSNSDQIFSVSLGFSLLILVFSIILAISILSKKSYPYKFVIFNLSFMFIAFLINGERDLFLRVTLISFVLYYTIYKRIKSLYLILIGIVTIFMIPVMHNLKNFWITKETNKTLSGNWIVDIFSSEFTSASNNLRIIYEANLEYKKGETIIWDILRFFSSDYHSTTQWFNEIFFPEVIATGGGRGFSFLGEGYLNFGLTGMLIWMAILGLIIKFLYFYSRKNSLTLLIYIISMPTFIYILRADFSNLFSGVIKQVVIPLFLLYILYWILTQILPNKNRDYLLDTMKGREKVER